MLAALLSVKKKAQNANAKTLKSLSKAVGDAKTKGSKGAAAGSPIGPSVASRATGSAEPVGGGAPPPPDVLPSLVFEGAGGDFVDAITEPLPEKVVAFARTLIGSAVTSEARKVAVIFVVASFDDPSLGPLDTADDQAARWASALTESGYEVCTLDTTERTKSYLQPTIRNVATVVRALSETVDMDDFSLVVGVITKGAYVQIPGTTVRKHAAFARDSSVVALGPTTVLLPEMLALPDCAGNCPTVFVDAAPIPYLPLGAGDSAGFTWFTGRTGCCAILAARYPSHHAGWLAYYLPRIVAGHGVGAFDGRRHMSAEDIAVFLGRKLVGRGAPQLDATGPLIGETEATADAANYAAGMPVPAPGTCPNHASRTVEEQRAFATLRASEAVTKEVLGVMKQREMDAPCRVWIELWLDVGDRVDPVSYHERPRQWARDFGVVLQQAITGVAASSAAAAARLSKHRRAVTAAAATTTKASTDRAPRLVYVVGSHGLGGGRCRFMLGEYGGSCLRDRGKRDRLYERLYMIASAVMNVQQPQQRQSYAIPDIQMCLADGYSEIRFRNDDEVRRAIQTVFPPATVPSPLNMSMMSNSISSSLALSAVAMGFRPVAVAVPITIAVDCTMRDARRLEKIRCAGQLRRYGTIVSLRVDSATTPKQHAAATRINAAARGRMARRRYYGLIRTVLNEMAARAHAVSSRDQLVHTLFNQFIAGLVRVIITEEGNHRHSVQLQERIHFLQSCEVRLVEVQEREEIVRFQAELVEERARMGVMESINRLKILHNSSAASQGILQWHSLDFRMLWQRYYVVLAEYQELLTGTNQLRQTMGTGAPATERVNALEGPPTDYEFASNLIVFPKEVRQYAQSLTKDSMIT
jgi:hypothetical protein